MKTLIAAILSLFLFPFSTPKPAEPPIPICHGTPNDMSAMAADPAFQMLHDNPVPFHYVSAAGEMMQFPTGDGKPANGFLLKAKKPSNKWLLVYQEWWGLNDNIKQQAEKFYNDLGDVNVLAVDMYDGNVATQREEAAKLVQSASRERLNAIMKGAISYVGPKARITSVGWCFGGMLSLQSALAAGAQAVGCVMYYGRPEQDVEKLKTLNTDVLGIFGSQDKSPSPEVVKQFEENMAKAGKPLTVKMYDANHGFANPSNPVFNKAAAEDAYASALSYLKKKLNS